MASRWSKAEDTALINTIGDAVPMNTVLQAVQAVAANGSQPKTLGAVRTRARNKNLGLDYRGSDIDGLFHKGVSRRQHKKKVITKDNESATIIGEQRTAGTVQAPTISEKPTKLSFGIIPQNSDRDALIAIYDDIFALLERKNYTNVKSITVDMDTAVLTLLKKGIA